MPVLVLGAWALLAWLDGEEPAAGDVEAFFEAADKGRLDLAVSIINLGEVFYITAKMAGIDTARRVVEDLEHSPLRTVRAGDDAVWAAAELKARFPISYADAFAASLAMSLGAELATGDPDFGCLEERKLLAVRWLSRRRKSRGKTTRKR